MSASTSSDDWTVASNVFYALLLVQLWWRGWLGRYVLQAVLILQLMYASINYHLCWTHDLGWCAGSHWTHDSGRDVALARDVMAAFQAMTGISAILVDRWWLHDAYGSGVATAYQLLQFTLTWWFVTLWNDGLEALLSLALLNGVLVLFALDHRVRQRATKPLDWFWWTRLVTAAIFLALGLTFRILSQREYQAALLNHQNDAYDSYHGWWHACTAIGSFVGVSLVEAGQHANYKSLV